MIVLKASDETIENRRAICDDCEHKKEMRIPVSLCSECGCIIEGKIRLASSECPLQKWGRQE